jgi:hypothetical protein
MPKAFAGAASNGMAKKCASLCRKLLPPFSPPWSKRLVIQQTARKLHNSLRFGGSLRATGGPMAFGSNLYIRTS